VPIYEPGLASMVAANRKRLTFTTDMHRLTDAADIILVAVPTPPTYSGDADLTFVEQVIEELPADCGDVILCMKSTVPVGTGRRMRARLDARGLGHVAYVSVPEFLKEGTAIADFMGPDRVVIGGDDAAAIERVARMHEALEAPIVRTDVATAEMIKVASNAFLATKISFINEIANVCEETGADVAMVAEGMGLDQRIGRHFLRPGIGFGGSCFGKDVAALKQLAGNSGYHFQLLNSVIEVNDLQKRRVVSKLKKHLGTLRGRKVALLGLAFKPGTDDMRDAASLIVASRLMAEGAVVSAHDPVAGGVARPMLPSVDICEDPYAALADADAAVLVTEWPQYAELDLGRVKQLLRTPLLVDGRNLFEPSVVTDAGISYECVGRPGVVGTTIDRRDARNRDELLSAAR
jgi:UDPglucose 6-dehydrogenase